VSEYVFINVGQGRSGLLTQSRVVIIEN